MDRISYAAACNPSFCQERWLLNGERGGEREREIRQLWGEMKKPKCPEQISEIKPGVLTVLGL